MGGVGPPPPSPLPNRYKACAGLSASHRVRARAHTGDFEILVVGHSSSDLVNVGSGLSASVGDKRKMTHWAP